MFEFSVAFVLNYFGKAVKLSFKFQKNSSPHLTTRYLSSGIVPQEFCLKGGARLGFLTAQRAKNIVI